MAGRTGTEPRCRLHHPELLAGGAYRPTSDLAAVLPTQLARYFAGLLPLQLFDLGSFRLDIVSIAQRERDAALQWLTEQIVAMDEERTSQLRRLLLERWQAGWLLVVRYIDKCAATYSQTTKNPPKRVFLTIRILPGAFLAMVDLP